MLLKLKIKKKLAFILFIWFLMCTLFASILVPAFESPDEVIYLSKYFSEGILGLPSNLFPDITGEPGAYNPNFAFAQNQCLYFGSNTTSDYRIFRLFYLIIPFTGCILLVNKFGALSLGYFLWPSTFYYSIQANPDIVQILLSSLIIFVNPFLLGAGFILDILLFDKSAICGLVFLLVYNIFSKIITFQRKLLIPLLVATVLISLILDILRPFLSLYLTTFSTILNYNDSVNIEGTVIGNQAFGQNSITQILSLIASLFFLGGSASFYPTPIFYVVFIVFMFSLSRKFKFSDKALYKTRKLNLQIAVAALCISFFILRILLPPIGQGRYWTIIIPFIVSYVGVDREINQRSAMRGLICLTFIANMWIYLVWIITCQ